MKTYRQHKFNSILLILAGTLSLFSGCNKDAREATSQICSQLRGVEAIYWDLMNGFPRTDIPGGLPIINSIGGTYSHPSFPLLGFIYPTGYTPETDFTADAVGINLIRNDNRSIWRYTSILFSGIVTLDQVIDNEIVQLRSFFGTTDATETVCFYTSTLPRAPGIFTNSSSVFIHLDNFTATVNVTITSQTGLGAVQINIATTGSPTDEFSNEILNTYLPIDYQLLYTNSGEIDSDGDGFPDNIDDFPFDASKH